MSHEHGVEHGLVVKFEVVLAQDGESFSGTHFHAAFGGFQLSGDGSQKSGFSCAVRTDDTVDVSVCELHVHVLVEDAFPELDGEVGKCNHVVMFVVLSLFMFSSEGGIYSFWAVCQYSHSAAPSRVKPKMCILIHPPAVCSDGVHQ